MTCAESRRGTTPPGLRSDSGSIPAMIGFPIGIAVVMLAINVGLIFFGRHVATAAAHEALAAAQVYGASATDGKQAADDILALTNVFEGTPQVFVGKTFNTTTVQVQAEVATPLIGIPNNMTITVRGPSERFYDEEERG